MSEIKCIDVSEWQGDIDWAKVKASGVEYAILRAGYGRAATQKDSKFDVNYKNAKANGIKLGVYWYSYAKDTADAEREADACLAAIRGKKLELPVFYDMEEQSQTKYGRSTLTSMCKAFCNKIKSGGFSAGVYSNPNWFKNYLDYTALSKLYPVWLAQYANAPQYKCDIWQYSSSGKISGIKGSVDMNILYNDKIIAPDKTDFTVRYDSNGGTGKMADQKITYGTPTALRINTFSRKGYTFVGWIAERPSGKVYGINSKSVQGWYAPSEVVTLSIYKDMQKVAKTAPAGDSVTMRALWIKNDGDCRAIGDINSDGKVNIKDVTELQKRIAELGG